MKRFSSLLALAILLLTISASFGGAPYPVYNQYLPPGTYKILIGFSAINRPVLADEVVKAANRWNYLLSKYNSGAVQIQVLPYGSTTPYHCQFAMKDLPGHYAETQTETYGLYLTWHNRNIIYRPDIMSQLIWYGSSNYVGNVGTEGMGVVPNKIFFNGNFDWSNAETCYHIALHEIGHLLGLAHPNEGGVTADSLMNTGSTGAYQAPGMINPSRSLEPSVRDWDVTDYDIENLQFLYATHAQQKAFWDQVADANTIVDPQARNHKLSLIYGKINDLADSRFSQRIPGLSPR